MAPILLSIEGNIGSGKSTLVNNLREIFNNNRTDLNIYFLEEPVERWQTITDKDGIDILQNYYADQKKYAFPFQMMAYISRLSLLRKALQGDYDVIITERSIFTDKMVFAKMLYDSDKIEEIEYKIYNMWFYEFIEDFPQVYIVYVKTMPEIADERVLSRNRSGETIPLDYLKECHRYHENWLTEIDSKYILTLDGNINLDIDKENTLNVWYSQIKKFIDVSLKN